MQIDHNQIMQYFSENLKTTYLAASEQARIMKQKFEYTLATLIFASLALSFQFSPSFGSLHRWILLLSWFLLFVAGISGGYRLMFIPEYMRLSGIEDYLGRRVNMGNILHTHPMFIDAVKNGMSIDPETFKPHTMGDLKKGLEKDTTDLQTVKRQVATLELKLPCAFNIQIWSLIAAYVVLAIFIVVNFH